jgi:tetratricopeptide (TPR) repeat protein
MVTFESLKLLTRRPPVIIAGLLVLAIVAFLGVNRLVNRFHEQEKALARHLYERGTLAQNAGNAEAAIGDFRAALGYSRDNPQYELSLARALRDTGRTAEAEAYLISLWERSPQEGPVNLALGRLFAREQQFDKAIQYYHNAIFGLWPGDQEARRRDVQFELIEFLLQHKAFPQAQAELITMASGLPRNAVLRLRVADLFAQVQDYEHALAQYQGVLRLDRENVAALYGAGRVAFELGRYRTAEGYLQGAVRTDPKNAPAQKLLRTASLVLQADPLARRISDAERNRRVRSAFLHAGERLDSCAQAKGISLNPQSPPVGLPSLKAQWLAIKPKLARLRGHSGDGTLDAALNLIFDIEQETQGTCGPPEGLDQALLLLGEDRAGVDR